MPVVAATRLESNVGKRNAGIGNTGDIAVAYEKLRISLVRLSNREYHLLLETGLIRGGIIGIGPHLPGDAESGPGIGPSGMKAACVRRAAISLRVIPCRFPISRCERKEESVIPLPRRMEMVTILWSCEGLRSCRSTRHPQKGNYSADTLRR